MQKTRAEEGARSRAQASLRGQAAAKCAPLVQRGEVPAFREVLLWVLGFGLAAHAYCYFNMAFSHDSLYQVVRSGNYATLPISNGRFLQPVYLAMRGPETVPWLIGLLSLLFVAVACFAFLRMFQVRSRAAVALVCGLMATNVVVAATNATYLHEADVYMLALALATLAAWSFSSMRLRGYAGAVLLLAAATALYQAYVSVGAVLLLACCIASVLLGADARSCLKHAGAALLVVGLALALYYCCMHAVMATAGVAAGTSYNSVSNIGDYSDMSLAASLVDAWKNTVHYLLFPEGVHPRLHAFANVVIIAASLAAIALMGVRRGLSAAGWAIVGASVLMMPLFANIANAASPGVLHTLMLYAATLVCPLAIALFDRVAAPQEGEAPLVPTRFLQLAGALSACLATLVLLFNIVGANQAYLLKDLQYHATEDVMVRVLDRVEQLDGYVAGQTPVYFYGTPSDSALIAERPGFDADYGAGFYDDSAITYDMRPYIEKILGYPMNVVLKSDVEGVVDPAAVASMGSFPDADSVAMVNGVAVVKFADVIGTTYKVVE